MELPETHRIVDETMANCKKDGIEFYIAKSHFFNHRSHGENSVHRRQLSGGVVVYTKRHHSFFY